MEEISNTVTPPGIVGMFKRPRQGEGGTMRENSQTYPIPLTVLCDGLRDPTNVGMFLLVLFKSNRTTRKLIKDKFFI